MLVAPDAVLDGDGVELVAARIVGSQHEDQLNAPLPTLDALRMDDEAGHGMQVGEELGIWPPAGREGE